jgi:hypothetical protein
MHHARHLTPQERPQHHNPVSSYCLPAPEYPVGTARGNVSAGAPAESGAETGELRHEGLTSGYGPGPPTPGGGIIIPGGPLIPCRYKPIGCRHHRRKWNRHLESWCMESEMMRTCDPDQGSSAPVVIPSFQAAVPSQAASYPALAHPEATRPNVYINF